MNFFEAQDQARKATRWLVFVYVVATALIVIGVTLIVGFALFGTSLDGYRYSFNEMLAANPIPLLVTALATALFIVGASIYKSSAPVSGRRTRGSGHGWHAGVSKRTGSAAPATQKCRRGNGDRIRGTGAGDIRAGGGKRH